jgi:hypothetical protein
MKITVQIADELYDHYLGQSEAMQQRGATVSAEELMADRLERFKAVDPGDRVVVIDPKSRQKLEGLLSGGSLMDADDLIRKVEGAMSIRIGDIRLDFTPGQMKEMAHLARRNGRALEEVVKDTVARMESLFFNHLG